MTDLTLTATFLLAPDIMEQGRRGDNIQAGTHLFADIYGCVQDPLAVVRAVRTAFLQAVLGAYPVQGLQ
jgi:hypothetical protein